MCSHYVCQLPQRFLPARTSRPKTIQPLILSHG
jgi:hypothetical protein